MQAATLTFGLKMHLFLIINIFFLIINDLIVHHLLLSLPVSIRVRTGPQHSLACCKRRLNGADETGKTEVPYHCRLSRCGTIKIPSLLKGLEH
jgi:hypothetical protein